MLFNLYFANNTILSCFLLFFLIIDLYFSSPAVAELIILNGIPNKEEKADMKTYPVIVEPNIRKC